MKPGERIRVDRGILEAAVLGGAVLGGGGGGWVEEGKRLGGLALEKGLAEILPIGELPDDALLLTVSGVGAPSAGSDVLEPEDYVRAVEIFIKKSGAKIGGLISSEIGALGVVNGWLQSAVLHLPLVDAPSNGRAHPLALMGSLGLHGQKDFVSLQAAAGGSTKMGRRVETFLKGSLAEVSQSIREASVRAGGMVAVARNPMPVSYVRENGAPGAIAMAVALGQAWLRNREFAPEQSIRRLLKVLGGDFLLSGRVEKTDLRTEGGLDAGMIWVAAREAACEITFWNEYMTFERDGRRMATFPDLIMTFNALTGWPLISAEIDAGNDIFIIAVPSEKLRLGAGLRDPELLRPVERALGKEIVRYGRWT